MSNEPDQPAETPKKRTRKPRVAKPRAPRRKDPGIAEIEEAARIQKADYRRAQASGAVLKRIIILLPKLTVEHIQALASTVEPYAQPQEFTP